uniref:Ig-like domain-containing protein n=1 Tax=Naja naja TaxID=35670 RepID=A0A8C6VPE5_NAJNA
MWLRFLLIIITISLLRGSTGQSVKQASGTVTVTEGQAVSLNCSYEAQYGGRIYTYWYIQHPRQPLKLLLTEYETYGKGFHAIHHKGDKNGIYNLEKEASQLKDSAVYFCAIRDTMRESRRGANQKQEKRIKSRDKGNLHLWHLHFKILFKNQNNSRSPHPSYQRGQRNSVLLPIELK